MNRAYDAYYWDATYLPPPSLGLFPPSVPGYRVSCREVLRAMSIDTLLEAARYLEWQAQQQQQTTRGELNSRPGGSCSTCRAVCVFNTILPFEEPTPVTTSGLHL